ncbi:MAG: AraC family transcriptional regulator [Sphaerochaetaceae bacterium]|nr:AraC family transcriptional regulator [Sphaerochaetaceae bacterium]
MNTNREQIEKTLIFLESLFPAENMCGIWCYDTGGKSISSTYSGRERSALENAMIKLGAMERILELYKAGQVSEPRLIGSSLGMQWAAVFEDSRKDTRIFVIGPVFYTSVSENQIRQELPPYISDTLSNMIGKIPIMSNSVLLNYVTNIHNAITGRNLSKMELYSGKNKGMYVDTSISGKRDREKIYMSEQEMLSTVREGNINYKNAFMKSISLSQGVPVQGKDPLRQAKTSLVVMETLISRAAMEGGLNPEIAYSLGDSYLKAIENSEDSGELFSLANAMFHDFVYRVHRTKNDKGYSSAVQKCCDFIEVSQNRRISAYDLSVLCGYSEYYITDKFKKETGVSLIRYIRNSKIEKSKSMLATTSMTINEIASHLAFNTTNYFIQSFKTVTGMTPTEYRKKTRKEPKS